MALFSFDNHVPKVAGGCYIAESAEVIGAVTLGENCYVGPGAKIRGDYGEIRIGRNTSIEENVVIHARPDEVCTIGDWVTLGHGCIIHNALMISDHAVIGMGAIVSDWAKVGSWAAVGEGAVVRNKQEIPAGAIAVGIPCKVIAETTEEWRSQWLTFKKLYVELANTYTSRLKRL
jgi:phenylacetic acid degradation protein